MPRKKRAFLFDRMLGKLCIKMRMLGYDAMLNPEGENGRFFLNATNAGRTAVTRARSMGDRPGRKPVILRSGDVTEQIVELFASTGETLFAPSMVLSYLVGESAEAVRGRIPPFVEENFHRFHRCPECNRIYWEGSHFQAMSDEVKAIEARLKRG